MATTEAYTLSLHDALPISLTINQGTPSTATTIKNAADDSVVNAALPLGSTVYDTAAVTNAGGFPLSGTVTFRLYPTSTRLTASHTEKSYVAVGSKTSNHGPLGAGGYSFQATYVARTYSNHDDSPRDLYSFPTRRSSDLSTATTIKNAADDSVVNAALPLGSTVYDTAAVTNAGGFPLSGTVTFR